MRNSKPEAGNKYFNTKSNGGYSTCIVGKPTDEGCNVLANCVGYACGAFNEQLGEGKEVYNLNCNAENFIERAISKGLSVVQDPVVGGIMVWQKGDTLKGSDGAGHVAFVWSKPDKDTVNTGESGYNSRAYWNTKRTRGNGNWGQSSSYKYRGCIVPPNYVAPEETDPFPGVTDEELAARVWAGEFGNGEDRKKALGSRFSAVQALVNKGVGKPEESTDKNTEDTEIKVGDIVIVNGVGTENSYGTGAKTKNFVNQKMKVIGIANEKRANRYALNQYAKGTPGDWSAVTGWFNKDSISK